MSMSLYFPGHFCLVTVSMGIPKQAIWAAAGRVSRELWGAGGVANCTTEWDVKFGME